MSMEEALQNWREPTPNESDDNGSSSDTSSYESEQLTPRPQKRPRGENDNDPDFDPTAEKRAPRTETHVASVDDSISQRLDVSL
jgi:hypothetical protein